MKFILLLLIVLNIFSNPVLAKNCQRLVAVYDIAVTVPNADPELYQASDGCVQQLLLNSKASNEFFSIEFQPMRILKPATEQVLIGASAGATANTDYIIWGELKDTGTGRYSIEVNLVTANTRRLVARGTSTFSSPSEAKFSGMTAALSIGGGTSSRPLIDIITDFEKMIREEDRRKAICPELIFLNPEKTIKTEANKEVLVMFQVKDADGKPVENANVSVRNYEGTFDKQEAKSDQYGMVKFMHKTPDKRTNYDITCFAKTTAPSEKTVTTDNIVIPVEVKKEITELTGEIEIKSITKTGNPTIDHAESEKSTFQTYTVSSLDITILPERIKQIIKSKEVLSRALSETDKFEIATGTTMKDASGEPTSVRGESAHEVYYKCEDKWELYRSEKIKGYSNGMEVIISISLERGSESGDMTISNLTPRYCLTITASNARLLFQPGKFKTTGKSSGQQRSHLCGELTSFSDELDPKTMLPMGVMNSTIKVNDTENHEFIIPLSIPNSKTLEEYLLDPVETFEINVSGKYIKKDYQETNTTISAKLILLPKD